MRTEQFFGENYHYIWSDSWYLDDNKAWFTAGAMDVLLCLDRNTNITKIVDRIPIENVCSFREHTRCIKRGNVIICLPDNGNDIWFYHLSDKSWSSIPVENPEKKRVSCSNVWIFDNRLYIISIGLKQIIELNIELECIENYYSLSLDNKKQISGSLMINGYIYIAGVFPSNIYKFNCTDKSIENFELLEINDQIQTICFDGEKFWLSGRCKKIYLWSEETKLVSSLNHFPTKCGIWNFNGIYEQLLNPISEINNTQLFAYSILVGDYIWFIPFQTNEIIYIHKENYKIGIFTVDEEYYTEENINSQLLQHKYLLEYVRDKRYIGLFSLKNKWVFEIDCKEFKYEICNYKIDDINKINEYIVEEIIKKNSFLYEDHEFCFKIWINCIMSEDKMNKDHNTTMHLGRDIYNNLIR